MNARHGHTGEQITEPSLCSPDTWCDACQGWFKSASARPKGIKPLMQTGVLAGLLVLWVLIFSGFYKKHLEWQATFPMPTIEATYSPELAMVYWVYPPHENVAILINAMNNTPGAEGVTIHVMGGEYRVWQTIFLHRNDSLIGDRESIFLEQGAGVDAMIAFVSGHNAMVEIDGEAKALRNTSWVGNSL